MLSLKQIKYFIVIYRKHILGVLAVVIIGILLFNMFKPEQSRLDENFDYSVEPESWIREEEDTIIVDVAQATSGNAQHVFSQQRYIDTDGSIVTLFYEGNYLGKAFKRVYYDEDDEAKMRIYPEMNPNDGVIDSFVLFKKEDGNFVFYLFVDEDWRELSNDNINVIWGSDIQDTDNLHYEPFDFTKNDDGIYYMKITDDIEWFMNQNPVTGRLFFGEITLQNVRNKDYDKTFVIVV